MWHVSTKPVMIVPMIKNYNNAYLILLFLAGLLQTFAFWICCTDTRQSDSRWFSINWVFRSIGQPKLFALFSFSFFVRRNYPTFWWFCFNSGLPHVCGQSRERYDFSFHNATLPPIKSIDSNKRVAILFITFFLKKKCTNSEAYRIMEMNFWGTPGLQTL